MSMKINKLEIENVKRIKAVKMEPTANGLTIIGGRNNQGKTSVPDSIAWALGGEAFRPSEAVREGSVIPPNLRVVMSNGLVVERRGKNSTLKVTDPSGQKAGQQLLDSFVEKLALNLPKFMESSGKEKAQTLLKIIGVGDQLERLDAQEKELYDRRRTIGQIADQKEKYAKEQPYYPEAPKELVSPSELIRQQQEILARNGENQRKRKKKAELETKKAMLETKVEDLKQELERLRDQLGEVEQDLMTASKDAADLRDESTAELEASLQSIEETNRKVRANLDKDKAEDDARTYREQYNSLTAEITRVRDSKTELLNTAELPLPELSVKDGELIYKRQQWDNMSGSDRLKVATAIVRKLNPECGFVLLDKLEQMDLDNLKEFGAWLEAEGLQAIATRVSTGEECSILIEDGYVVGADQPAEEAAVPQPKIWQKGVF